MLKTSTFSFTEFNLDKRLMQALDKENFNHATTIQEQAIPVILNKKDILASAQTGSGKTLAFCLPMLQNLIESSSNSTSPAKHPVLALVLAPTRELAQQIHKVIYTLAQFTDFRIALLLGGEPIQAQTSILQKGADIIIATPGRLLDHITSNTVKLNQIKILALDEADKMLDMGFLPDLEKIFTYTPNNKQTLLFSATFSGHIKKLTENYQNNPVVIQAHAANSSNLNVEQSMYYVNHYQRLSTLKQILRQESGQCIIFTNSKIDCKKLQQDLGTTYGALSIHGDMTQTQRMEHLNLFKSNNIKVLVATDVASRGLDIPDLPLVINYNLPFQPEDYVHRIGRTGRAGKNGKAISLYTEKDSKLKIAIENLVGEGIIKHTDFDSIQVKVQTISSSNNKSNKNKIATCALFKLK